MTIIRLLLSIFIPPVGLILNFILGAETTVEKICTWISGILTALFAGFIIFVFIIVGANNSGEEDLLRCRNPHHCDYSDGEYQTCYYCKNDRCTSFGKIQCVNDGERFNYTTVDGEDEEIEEE